MKRMSHVFSRVLGRSLPVAARAEGALIWDGEGRRYIDGAGGAIVVGIGHGRSEVARAIADQASRVAYAHGTAFTSEPLEAYADALAPLLPMEDARIYPVSGGSEAVETALKLARAYHLARGEPSRHRIIARRSSYHGNTLGALDASGREALRRPYEPWLGRATHVSPAYEYRCELPDHPRGCGAALAGELDAAIRREGAGTVACFIAEPVAGATLGAAVPSDDYWPAIREVCDHHGVLLIADEVMTGFGRTGTWFGCDQWDVRPDILTAGKGTSSGYWPLGLAACSGQVYETVAGSGFTHGFTYSHSVAGAAAGLAVLGVLRDENLVDASRAKGELLRKQLTSSLGEHPNVGDVRGLGLMVGVELVADRESKRPFPRADAVTERVLAAAKERGLLVYPSTGCADGADGDLFMFGPPFVITDDELEEAVAIASAAIASVLPA
jgi:adenosylmethionine-8-amino-7-oxononanoate aminotransferase